MGSIIYVQNLSVDHVEIEEWAKFICHIFGLNNFTIRYNCTLGGTLLSSYKTTLNIPFDLKNKDEHDTYWCLLFKCAKQTFLLILRCSARVEHACQIFCAVRFVKFHLNRRQTQL